MLETYLGSRILQPLDSSMYNQKVSGFFRCGGDAYTFSLFVSFRTNLLHKPIFDAFLKNTLNFVHIAKRFFVKGILKVKSSLQDGIIATKSSSLHDIDETLLKFQQALYSQFHEMREKPFMNLQ